MDYRSGGEQKFQIIAVLFVIAVISISVLFFFNSYIATENNRYAALAAPFGHNYLGQASVDSAEPGVQGVDTVEEKKLKCSDCKYFPVNKDNSLDSSYVPSSLVPMTLSGGGSLTKESLDNLKNLFSDAMKENISIKVVSSYRSYQTQIVTFNNWVGVEKSKGLTSAEAKISANEYSAKEGHSEHQLGTTVDLACKSCIEFINSSGNLKLYSFIENNAYKYGFVLSYPKEKDKLTGYRYEPWHIRYIGIDLATEIYNRVYLTNTSDYLAKFLEEKQLWK